MFVLPARPVSIKNRPVALLSAASAVAIVVGAAAPQQARADDYTWQPRAVGLAFFDAGNWSPSGGDLIYVPVPPPDGARFIYNNSTNVVGQDIRFGAGTYYFVINGAETQVSFYGSLKGPESSEDQTQFTFSGDGLIGLNAKSTYKGATIIDQVTLGFYSVDQTLDADSAITIRNGGTLDLGAHQHVAKSLTLSTGTLKNGTLLVGSSVASKGGTIDGVVATGIALTTNSGTTNLTGTSTFGDVTVKNTSTLTLYTDAEQTLKLKTLTVDAGGTLIIGANGKGLTLENANNSDTDLTVTLGGTVKFVAGDGVNLSDSRINLVDKSGTEKGSFTKQGTGTLSLVTKHSYTGDTLIEAGTLQLGANDLISSGSKVIIKTGATFDLGGKSQTTNTLSLDGGTLKNGTFKGAITSNGGTIDSIVATNVALTTNSGNTNLIGSSTFGDVTVKNGTTLTLYNNVNIEDPYQSEVLNLKTLTVDAGGTLIVGANNKALNIVPADDFNYELVITLNLTIKSNMTQTTLKGTNSFANITLENGGMLGISGKTTATSVSLGTNAFLDIGTQGVDGLLVSDVSSSGEIQWHTTSNATYDGVISGSGTFAKYSSGTLTFSKAQTYTGATTIDGGTLKLAAAQGLSADSAVKINARGTLDLGGTGHYLTVTLNGGTLTSGQLIEGGADDHTVASRITANGGRITDVIGNADLSLAAAQEGVFTTTLSGTNAFHKITIGSNALGIVIGETTVVESITVEGNGALQMGDGTTNGLVKQNVTNNGAVIFEPANNQTYDYVISGGGSLFKEGSADLTLNKAQTYSGGTTINGGKLILTTVNGLSADSVVTINRGATLDLGGKSQKLNLVTLNNGTLTSGKLNAGQNEAYDVESNDGVVHNVSTEGAGTVKLKAKSGTTTLTGTNSFSAVTVAANATLELGDGTTDGSVSTDIANEGTVVFITKNDQSWSKVVSNNDGVGKLVKDGAGKLTISAKQTYTGSTTINAGEMLLDVDQALSRASDITVAGGILTVNGTNTFASVLVKSGATWVANDATKTTTVNGNVTFNANATYKINVTADDASKLDIKGGLNIDVGAKLIVNAIGDGFVTKDYTIATTSDGVDSAFADADTIFGVSVAGASSSWNTRGMGSGTMESFQLAAYGRRSFGALDVTASLGFGQHWIGTDRTTFQQRGVSADFTGQTVSARVETGYRFTENWRGFVAMQGQRFTAQGFTEKGMAGDNFILTTGDQSGGQSRMEAGARFEDIFRMPDGRQLFLRSQIAWARSQTSTPDVHSGFATLVGSRFSVSGTSAGPDALAIATSLDLPLSKAIAIGARVDGEWTNNSRGVSGQASFSVRW